MPNSYHSQNSKSWVSPQSTSCPWGRPQEKRHTCWETRSIMNLIDHKGHNSFDHVSFIVHGCRYWHVVLVVSEVLELCLMVSHGVCPIWCLYPTIWWNSYDFGLIHYLTWLYHCGHTTAWSMDFLRPFVVFSVFENVGASLALALIGVFYPGQSAWRCEMSFALTSLWVSLVRWTSPK